MRKNYCIVGLKSLKDLPELDLAQFTLNSRTYPAKRHTVEALNVLRTADKCGTPVIVHYDFVYIISRYSMFNNDVKSDIIAECADIIRWTSVDQNTLGIIMHTDYPLAKEVKDAASAKEHYKAGIWNTQRICDDLGTDIVAKSIDEFYHDLRDALQLDRGCKIYLENTVKVGPQGEGSVEWLGGLFAKHPEYHELFGLCIDTEHDAAITGEYWPAKDFGVLQAQGFSLICHLNTIPDNAPMGKGKDRHSDTTVAECTVNSVEFYKDYTKYLDYINVPWVREVKEDTMYREIEQLKNV